MSHRVWISALWALLAAVACDRRDPAPKTKTETPAAQPESPAPKVEAPAEPTIAKLVERLKESNGKDKEAGAALKQRIKHDDVSLVIDQLDVNYPGWDPILTGALEQVVTDDDKALIIDKYKTKISLIQLIRAHHWESDVKDTLVQQINNNSQYVPVQCIEALASLKQPDTYPALKSYFVNGWNRHTTYGAIALLPGIDLKKELPIAWEKAVLSSSKFEAAYLIGPILDSGYLPGMEFVMDQLRRPSDLPTTILDPDMLSSRYLDHAGDVKEKLLWWDKNKRKLRFDAARKKFALPA